MLIKRRSVLAGSAALAALAIVRPSFAAGTGNIFVSTEKGNEVVVLDKTFNIIKRIATSRRPRDMQMTKAHDLLYVACGDDDSIDVIDVAKLEVIDSIPTGPSPEMFRLSDDEKSVYVSDEENSTVERIDLESKVATQTIPSGAEPEGKAAPEILEHPGRLLHPMRRTAPKDAADPGWEQITWDEALDTIAARLRAVADADGAEAVAFSSSSPSTTAISDAIDWVETLAAATHPDWCGENEVRLLPDADVTLISICRREGWLRRNGLTESGEPVDGRHLTGQVFKAGRSQVGPQP